jgi:hypothetical protein
VSRIRRFLALALLVLAGCTSPRLIPAPVQTAVKEPTAAIQTPLSRVATLSPGTPPPVVPSATLLRNNGTGLQVTLNGDGFVNLRTGPASLYPVVGRAANGSRMAAVARSEHSEWLLLASPDLPGGQAWVYAAYTDYNPDQHPLPIATPMGRPPQP